MAKNKNISTWRGGRFIRCYRGTTNDALIRQSEEQARDLHKIRARCKLSTPHGLLSFASASRRNFVTWRRGKPVRALGLPGFTASGNPVGGERYSRCNTQLAAITSNTTLCVPYLLFPLISNAQKTMGRVASREDQAVSIIHPIISRTSTPRSAPTSNNYACIFSSFSLHQRACSCQLSSTRAEKQI